MFPKSKASTIPSDNQAKEKLANYVYEYLIHLGATKAAQTFLQEINWDKAWPIAEPPGFLNQWWCVFYDLYSAAPERRESFEHSNEAKAFHDYGFVNSGFQNGLSRNPSNASPISGGMPPSVGRPPSSQGILPPDNGMHAQVSIPGSQMMLPSGHYFAPNHPMANFGDPRMEMMRNRPIMQPMRLPAPANMYNIPRHRNMQQQLSGNVHSPGPTGPSQIMASPNDSLQQNEQQQNASNQNDPFALNGPSTRSPAHNMSQPQPAFPPPPTSDNSNSDQSHLSMMNGSANSSQMPQFPQQQQHTMEYMPSNNNMSFDPSQSQMKHSPQLHANSSSNNPSMSDVLASMNGGGMPPNEFCSPMMPNGGPSFANDLGASGLQRLGHMTMSQMHMMQQGLGPNHGHLQSMAAAGGTAVNPNSGPGPGIPPMPTSFMSQHSAPNNNQCPVSDDYYLNLSQ